MKICHRPANIIECILDVCDGTSLYIARPGIILFLIDVAESRSQGLLSFPEAGAGRDVRVDGRLLSQSLMVIEGRALDGGYGFIDLLNRVGLSLIKPLIWSQLIQKSAGSAQI